MGHGAPAPGKSGNDVPAAPVPESRIIVQILCGDAIEPPHEPFQAGVERIGRLNAAGSVLLLAAAKRFAGQPLGPEEASICPMLAGDRKSVRLDMIDEIASGMALGHPA